MTSLPEAFLRESTPRQLGALAASLARVASSARKPARTQAIPFMLDECIHFIEHLGPNVDPEAASALADMQLMLGLWRESWPSAQDSQAQRVLLYLQSQKWSEQTLQLSALLESTPTT